MARVFGAKKDRFDPEIVAKYFKPTLRATPDIADLEPWRYPTQDQLDAGYCVGFAFEGILVGKANAYGIKLPKVQRISPSDICNGGRYIDGTLGSDEGTYPTSVLQWLSMKGCLPYCYWEYKGFEKRSRPSALDVEAAKYPLESYEGYTLRPLRITGGIAGIHAAMSEGHMVAIALPFPDDWMDSPDGVLPKLTTRDTVAGWHEMYFYKSLWKDKVFMGANSWGTKLWSPSGKVVPKGCFVMRHDAFDWFKYQGGYDAHGVEIDPEVWGGVTPTPEPVPPITGIGGRFQVTKDSGQSWDTIFEKVLI